MLRLDTTPASKPLDLANQIKLHLMAVNMPLAVVWPTPEELWVTSREAIDTMAPEVVVGSYDAHVPLATLLEDLECVAAPRKPRRGRPPKQAPTIH